jgi:UDP-N-acetylglucosamine--N-acetylmuramyl-(pentapeptide) pyrophosphoryl-undecaprenol N-acetylglucosamine transferase
MRVILSAGGTGGHIYPAIAIAHALKQEDAAHEILFVGAQRKIEMQQVPAAGYSIIGLPIQGINRRHVFQNLLVPFKLLVSLWKARQVIKQFKPDIVIGTGGYASAATVYMATCMKIPTLIQEQNAYPGLTNQLLSKRVDKICVAYGHMDQYFPANKLAFTGNPVRQDIRDLPKKRQSAYEYFCLNPGKPCLLVLGGSQGAQPINQSVLQAVPDLLKAGIQMVWATGQAHVKIVKSQIGPFGDSSIKVFPFIEKMDLALAAADIVVSRAGALSIAELCLAGKPTIFIPSPHVAADHQTKNILPLAEKKAAIVLSEQEALQKLGTTIIQLLGDPNQQIQLSRNIQLWAKPHATNYIIQTIKQLAK